MIRPAIATDAPALYGIFIRAHTDSYYGQLIPKKFQSDFYEHYTWQQEEDDEFAAGIIRKIRHPEWHVAVAVQDDQIIGYTFAHSKSEAKLILYQLFVDPNQHAKGTGTALLQTALSWAEQGQAVQLSVMENNVVARSLYEKWGFRAIGVKDEDYFGVKMVRMWRDAD